MNMFKSSKAKTVEGYIAAVPEPRKKLIVFLHRFIKKTVPGLKPYFAYNMLGYGSFPYRNHRNEPISWPVVAMANQKNYVSIYVCAVDGKQYVAEKYKASLGKVSVGRSCIRFKKVEDIHLPTLKKVLQFAAKKPGLAGAEEYRKKS